MLETLLDWDPDSSHMQANCICNRQDNATHIESQIRHVSRKKTWSNSTAMSQATTTVSYPRYALKLVRSFQRRAFIKLKLAELFWDRKRRQHMPKTAARSSCSSFWKVCIYPPVPAGTTNSPFSLRRRKINKRTPNTLVSHPHNQSCLNEVSTTPLIVRSNIHLQKRGGRTQLSISQ